MVVKPAGHVEMTELFHQFTTCFTGVNFTVCPRDLAVAKQPVVNPLSITSECLRMPAKKLIMAVALYTMTGAVGCHNGTWPLRGRLT